MASKKELRERIDILLVAKGLAESREQAKRLIIANQVSVAGLDRIKPGQLVGTDTEITLKQKPLFVSRGGLKLEKALTVFGLDVKGSCCIDIGASTGGFTDCMLQRGAEMVYAVDVGLTQLHEKVRIHPKVCVMDNTNARNLEPAMCPVRPVFAAVDVSFISILKVCQPLYSVMQEGKSNGVFLVKPQFEAGRKAVAQGKGIIKGEAVHAEILNNVLDGLSDAGWNVNGLIPSPITGGSGNIEFLCWVSNNIAGCNDWRDRIDIDLVVRTAGATFNEPA